MFEPTLILSQNNHHQVLLGRCTNYRQKWDLCQPRKKKNYDMNAFTPLSPGCDQDRISPYTISTISSRQVMRIKKNINYRWNQFQILQTSIIWIVRQKVRRITDEILGVQGLRQILAPSLLFFETLVLKLKNSCWHWKRIPSQAKKVQPWKKVLFVFLLFSICSLRMLPVCLLSKF